VIERRRERRLVADWFRRLSVRPPDPDRPARTFSGAFVETNGAPRAAAK